MKKFTIDDANKEHNEVRSILKKKKEIISRYKKELDLLPKKMQADKRNNRVRNNKIKSRDRAVGKSL